MKDFTFNQVKLGLLCVCVSVWSKQYLSWLRHDSTWGCLPSPLYSKASIYPQDWLFWLTKAQESQCTTCYAAEVCQASNTCSPFRCLFHYSSSLPLSPRSRGTFVYASDFFPPINNPILSLPGWYSYCFFTFSIGNGPSLSLFAAKCDLACNLDAWIFFH